MDDNVVSLIDLTSVGAIKVQEKKVKEKVERNMKMLSLLLTSYSN